MAQARPYRGKLKPRHCSNCCSITFHSSTMASCGPLDCFSQTRDGRHMPHAGPCCRPAIAVTLYLKTDEDCRQTLSCCNMAGDEIGSMGLQGLNLQTVAELRQEVA